VVLIRVALERLGMTGSPVEIALGGGLVQSGDQRLISAIEAGLGEVASAATAHVTSSPPVVGAALLGLDELEADPEAQARARDELGKAYARIDKQPRDGRE
jgi:hypothetical protein